jgi:hypothetical protein
MFSAAYSLPFHFRSFISGEKTAPIFQGHPQRRLCDFDDTVIAFLSVGSGPQPEGVVPVTLKLRSN